ncbi:MAG: FKBP-type peptidyl-prolyl cis-trans isomerase [Bacteroidaceae bacterium]|nr:FKBP-type peptidyl-prolyl cis-trans isomerase [Bacteroidaceae bacterium]
MSRILTISCLVAIFVLAACSKDGDSNAYDSYQNWKARNTAWYNELQANARKEIDAAKALYGDKWEENCPWRIYLSTSLDKGTKQEDSIVMRLVKQCPANSCPLYTDSVYINYRGWLMKTTYRIDGLDTTYCTLFDQSFYGYYAEDDLDVFDDKHAYPSKGCVKSYVDGFTTALQYMHEGEQAHVYIPSYLAYGDETSNGIPGGSTLHFFLHLRNVYPTGTPVPDWK